MTLLSYNFLFWWLWIPSNKICNVGFKVLVAVYASVFSYSVFHVLAFAAKW